MVHRSMNTSSSSGICSYRMKPFYRIAYSSSEAPPAPNTHVMPQTVLLLSMKNAGNPAIHSVLAAAPPLLMPVSIGQCKNALVHQNL